MKKIALILVLCLVTWAFPTGGAMAAKIYVERDDFESYGETVGGRWAGSGYSTVIPAGVAENGKCMVLETSPTAAQENKYTLSSNLTDKTAVIRFSAKFSDYNAIRQVYAYASIPGKKQYIALVNFYENGTVVMGNGTATNIKYETNKWYDVVVFYVPSTGDVQVVLSDGEEYKSASGKANYLDAWTITLIDIVSAKGQVDGKMYFDNFSVHGLDYIPAGAPQQTELQHEDFENSSDGLSGNWSWNGTGKVTTEETDKGYSLAVPYFSDKSCEIKYTFSSNMNQPHMMLRMSLKFEDFAALNQLYTYASIPGKKAWVALVNFTDDGSVQFGNGTDTQIDLETDKWYDFVVVYTPDTGEVELTVGDTEGYTHVSGSANYSGAWTPTFICFNAGKTENQTKMYADDLSIFGFSEKPDAASAKTPVDFSTAFSEVSVSTDCITITFAENTDGAILDPADFKINNDTSFINQITKNKNTLTVTLAKPLEYGADYIFEGTLQTENAEKINLFNCFYTGEQYKLADFKITEEDNCISTSVMASTADVSEIRKCILVFALYNADNGAMLDIVADETVLKNAPVVLKVEFSKPVESGSYEVISYIWDGTDTMQSLISPKAMSFVNE